MTSAVLCKLCPDHLEPAPILDTVEGDCVCSRCGMVVESCAIDLEAEWRNFAETGVDNSRCGAAVDPFRSDFFSLRTYMSSDSFSKAHINLARTQGRVGGGAGEDAKADRLISAIKSVSEALNVHEVGAITMRAMETVPKLLELNSRAKLSHLAASVLLWACREAGFPRTFGEVYC
eukprot:TRINITY_DN9873_c0_g1_i1.p1 TRINITY_DN9873_c0_g1~~TRINITY_DN9873_c0_g1_i1.p1  ORF type:complete len:176 (+),score=37.68 TRINITY_DN9873_c0_g1_i1:150-677(+)